MNYELKSAFAKDMMELVELKKALGYSEGSYIPKVKAFDEFCVINYPNTDILLEPIAVTWIKHTFDSNRSAVNERISFLRLLAKYQRAIGKNAYVIQEQYSAGKSIFFPYLLTDLELSNLFNSIDSLHPKNNFRQLQISTYFRLTYTCGLRPKEGRELQRKDVDLDTAEIRLINSKWHKSRTIVMSDDMTELMKKYVSARDAKYDIDTYLFPRLQGGPYTATAMLKALKRAFEQSKPDIDKDLLPAIRVYDLRHRFATKVLHNWLDAGVNLNSRLPYLQAYMGHKELSATAYYVHLLPENLIKSAGIDWESFDALLPEVELWEK